MGKSKPSQKRAKTPEKNILHKTTPIPSKSTSSPPETSSTLLIKAREKFTQGDVEAAANLAKRALGVVPSIESIEALPALNLLGELHVELGEIPIAQEYFQIAAALDPEGEVDEALGGGAEKFMWLAQLSEEGGDDSVGWFEKGAACLTLQMQRLLESAKTMTPQIEEVLEEKRRKLATALCSACEVYMTDLSWEEDAEQRCEALVTQATMVAPNAAESWQTLANVRISQDRIEDAKAALVRSIEIWKDLAPEHPAVPDYPTRVSLVRLLMDAEMEEEAVECLERLLLEDDQSVEVWYLGGWALFILGDKQKDAGDAKGDESDAYKATWISSRQWLNNSMTLFKALEYEDERLGEHAKELIGKLDADLGPVNEEEEALVDWEEEDASDEEMGDA